jgi:hypothetical protein
VEGVRIPPLQFQELQVIKNGNLVPGGVAGPPCRWGTNADSWSSRIGVGCKGS